jgi:selenocysteine lyase/cysteine desulfurase
MSSDLVSPPRSKVRSALPAVSSALTCQRGVFSIPADVHYLNCAYMAPISRSVEAAGVQALLRKRLPTALPPEEFFAGPNRLREAFAQLVNIAQSHRVALVPSVSYAMATAVLNLPTTQGQNVVVIGDEFPSAVLPWRRLTRERGLTLRPVLPSPGPSRGSRWNEMLCEAIDTATAVVVLSHVHWSDGTMFDLVQIAARARAVGAAIVVDGTQSVGALPFDVSAVQPDLLVCAGYKWLMGGYGVSLAYFGPRFDNGQPLEDVWTGQLGSDDFSRLAIYRDAYRPGVERYDCGERASFMLVPMLCEAIQQIMSWGVDRIQQYCTALMDPWLDHLSEYGVDIEASAYRSAHLFGLRFIHPRDAHAVAAALSANRVHVSVRGTAIRVSPNVYNDAEDIAAMFDALHP